MAMKHLRFVLLGVLAVAALVLAACGGDGAGDPTPTGTVSGSPTPTATVPPPATATPDNTPVPTETASLLETLLPSLREDLAQSFIVNPIDTPDSIKVVRVEEVVWPDQCLNPQVTEPCPPPFAGSPGYRVTLQRLDFGVEYVYHTEGTERFAGPYQLPLPSPTPVSPDALPSEVLEFLRDRLSVRFSVTPESIQAVAVEEAIWANGCLGLPAVELCPAGLTAGYRVTLLVMGQEQIYHTGGEDPLLYVGPVAQ